RSRRMIPNSTGAGRARSCRAWEQRKSMRSNRSLLATAIVALVLVAGCRQDMHNQPKYRPLRPSALFADGSSARQPVEGTVARGTLITDEALFTGMQNGAPVAEMPFAITAQDLDRGQERYNIFCAPCHDQTGSGTGMVVQRGYRQPPSFHIERLKPGEPG